MHGLSLNVEPDLTHFSHIVPCGIADKPVTSLAEMLPGRADARLSRVQPLLLEHFADVFEIELNKQLEAVPPDPRDVASALSTRS